jgi:hypothetical protein
VLYILFTPHIQFITLPPLPFYILLTYLAVTLTTDDLNLTHVLALSSTFDSKSNPFVSSFILICSFH